MDKCNDSKIYEQYKAYLNTLGFSDEDIQDSVDNKYSISRLLSVLSSGCLSTTLRPQYSKLFNASNNCDVRLSKETVVSVLKLIYDDRNEYAIIKAVRLTNICNLTIDVLNKNDFNLLMEENKKRLLRTIETAGEV